MSGADYDNVRRKVNELRPLIITEKEKFCLTVQAYIPAMSEYDRKYQHKQEIEEFNNRVYEQILDKETIILASKLFELISDNVELEFGASAGRFEDRLRKQIKSLTVKANLLIFIRLTETRARKPRSLMPGKNRRSFEGGGDGREPGEGALGRA